MHPSPQATRSRILQRAGDRLAATLLLRAEQTPDVAAFVMLNPDLEHRRVLTYAALLGEASGVGARLLEFTSGCPQAALIACKSEEAFIRAVYGCLMAGVTAIPTSLPASRKNRAARLFSILSNSGAQLVICDETSVEQEISALAAKTGNSIATWMLAPDDNSTHAVDSSMPGLSIEAHRTAFIQFTSGSTSESRGAVISHRNVMANLRTMAQALPLREGEKSVNWCPLYHDMGLIANVFLAVALGVTNHMLSPLAFLQRPVRWLQAISRYQASISGGPNFAYEECVSRTTDEDLRSVELGAWRLALNGAEPVRAATLERFAIRFERSGFSRRAFLPCYGLAENTLWVAGRPAGEGAHHFDVDAAALALRRVVPASGSHEKVSLVSCGPPGDGVSVRIVDPAVGRVVTDGAVGEIWVSGSSVACGYWNHAQATNETFRATLDDSGQHWLRTGDLGALWQDELLICGRLKEVVIVRGLNYHPVDIEQAAQDADDRLVRGAGVAFSSVVNGVERVTLVQELQRGASRQGLEPQDRERIIAAVLASTGACIDHLITVRPGCLPRTTSGKLQRAQVRELYKQPGQITLAPSAQTQDLEEEKPIEQR